MNNTDFIGMLISTVTSLDSRDTHLNSEEVSENLIKMYEDETSNVKMALMVKHAGKANVVQVDNVAQHIIDGEVLSRKIATRNLLGQAHKKKSIHLALNKALTKINANKIAPKLFKVTKVIGLIASFLSLITLPSDILTAINYGTRLNKLMAENSRGSIETYDLIEIPPETRTIYTKTKNIKTSTPGGKAWLLSEYSSADKDYDFDIKLVTNRFKELTNASSIKYDRRNLSTTWEDVESFGETTISAGANLIGIDLIGPDALDKINIPTNQILDNLEKADPSVFKSVPNFSLQSLFVGYPNLIANEEIFGTSMAVSKHGSTLAVFAKQRLPGWDEDNIEFDNVFCIGIYKRKIVRGSRKWFPIYNIRYVFQPRSSESIIDYYLYMRLNYDGSKLFVGDPFYSKDDSLKECGSIRIYNLGKPSTSYLVNSETDLEYNSDYKYDNFIEIWGTHQYSRIGGESTFDIDRDGNILCVNHFANFSQKDLDINPNLGLIKDNIKVYKLN